MTQTLIICHFHCGRRHEDGLHVMKCPTMIVLVAMVIFLDKHGLNAFLKPFMLVFNEWGTYARPPRQLRMPTRSSTTKRWRRPNVIKSFIIDASLSIFHLMPDQIPTNIRTRGKINFWDTEHTAFLSVKLVSNAWNFKFKIHFASWKVSFLE